MMFWLISLPPVVQKINASYDRIETLQGEVTRYFTFGEQKQMNIGKFYLKKPDKLWVKYAKPEETVVLNDTLLWLYLPAKKKVLKMNYAELPPLKKHLIGIESFLGLNPIQGLEHAFEFEVQDESTLVVKPKDEGKIISKVIFQVEPQRSIILSAEIFDLKGNIISSTDYEDWKKIDGVWFPQKVISWGYSDEKEFKEEHIFQQIRINHEIEEERFNFTLPEGIEIINE